MLRAGTGVPQRLLVENLFCSGDNLILERLPQVNKIGAKPIFFVLEDLICVIK